MSVKSKQVFVCQECGAVYAKWQGRCTACGEWNSVVEEVQTVSAGSSAGLGNLSSGSAPQPIAKVSLQEVARLNVGVEELNLVLGGGLVPGSLTLLGGEPGIGKAPFCCSWLWPSARATAGCFMFPARNPRRRCECGRSGWVRWRMSFGC